MVRKRAKKSEWSPKKKQTAKALAEGIETQRDIAKRLNIKESSISRWKLDPEFLQYVDDLTLGLERHTLAGMLRRLDGQQAKTKIGKNDWLKIEEMKAKLLGYFQQKIVHAGIIAHEHELDALIADDPEIRTKVNELLKDIAQHRSRVRVPGKPEEMDPS